MAIINKEEHNVCDFCDEKYGCVSPCPTKLIEKQKPVDFSDLRTWKYIVDAVWTEKEGIGQYLDSPFTEEVAKKLQKRFGKIEQKPADKVEPKFHEGDWIIGDKDNTVRQVKTAIKNVSNGKYAYDLIDGGYISTSHESDYHLWTIQDARDGDVLVASDGSIFLFKCTIYCACKHYVALTTDNVVNFNEGLEHYWETSRAVHPATKEQRDTLMKAMADAGYTFDFEKKELKKIVVPIFKIGDTIIKKHNSDILYFGSFTITDITGGKYWYNDRIICDITEQDEWELFTKLNNIMVKNFNISIDESLVDEQVITFCNITKDMCELYAKKNHDYGNSFDEGCNKIGTGYPLGRLLDKMNRLIACMGKEDEMQVNESIEDTLTDLACYSVMTLSYLRRKKNDNK